MGSSSFTRVAAGLFSGGLSEVGQKKPLQDIGKNNPQRNPAGVKGLGGVFNDPIHAVGKAFSGIMPKPKTPATVDPVSQQAVQQAVSDASARRSKSRGFRSTILSQNFLSADNPALKETFGA